MEIMCGGVASRLKKSGFAESIISLDRILSKARVKVKISSFLNRSPYVAFVPEIVTVLAASDNVSCLAEKMAIGSYTKRQKKLLEFRRLHNF